MARVYNFSAGPSMLPEAVLKTAQAELLDYHGSGMSVMEMSHRSKWFDEIIINTEAAMRRVLNIPDNYKVGFFQGGATQQFAMVPLNFMTTGTADYLVTGNFSKKAAEEAAKFGTARIAASSKDKNFTYIPDVAAIDYDPNASYIHICQNNTIFGTQYVEAPQVEGVPLVADMSSMICSEPVDVSKYGVIYFGVQKNVAPAGLAIAIVRAGLLGRMVQFFIVGLIDEIVLIHKSDPISTGTVKARIFGTVHTFVFLMDHPDPAVSFCNGITHGGTVIRGAIVHQNHFKIIHCLAFKSCKHTVQISHPVKVRNNY